MLLSQFTRHPPALPPPHCIFIWSIYNTLWMWRSVWCPSPLQSVSSVGAVTSVHPCYLQCQSVWHTAGTYSLLGEPMNEYKQVLFYFGAIAGKQLYLPTVFKGFFWPLIIPLGVALQYICLIKWSQKTVKEKQEVPKMHRLFSPGLRLH